MDLYQEATRIVSEMITKGTQNAIKILKNADRIRERDNYDYEDNYGGYDNFEDRMEQGKHNARCEI